ncbi:MAG: twin-arginine translocase TatA/TatE family subunit [Candidatus Gastranaerophilaceae bacterium]
MSLGFTEIFLIITVILLLFGSKRIPELARALGRAKHEFEKAKDTIKQEAQGIRHDIETMAEQEAKNE